MVLQKHTHVASIYSGDWDATAGQSQRDTGVTVASFKHGH